MVSFSDSGSVSRYFIQDVVSSLDRCLYQPRKEIDWERKEKREEESWKNRDKEIQRAREQEELEHKLTSQGIDLSQSRTGDGSTDCNVIGCH